MEFRLYQRRLSYRLRYTCFILHGNAKAVASSSCKSVEIRFLWRQDPSKPVTFWFHFIF